MKVKNGGISTMTRPTLGRSVHLILRTAGIALVLVLAAGAGVLISGVSSQTSAEVSSTTPAAAEMSAPQLAPRMTVRERVPAAATRDTGEKRLADASTDRDRDGERRGKASRLADRRGGAERPTANDDRTSENCCRGEGRP
jgi:hypothetical protein